MRFVGLMNSIRTTCVAEKWLKSQIMRLKKKKKKYAENTNARRGRKPNAHHVTSNCAFQCTKAQEGSRNSIITCNYSHFSLFFLFFSFLLHFLTFFSQRHEIKVILDTVYFVEIENLLLKVLLIKIKIS